MLPHAENEAYAILQCIQSADYWLTFNPTGFLRVKRWLRMGTCFVIMPVTTPEHFLPTYNNDGAHFQHVLEHLFRPALEQLDFEVIPPTVAGADLIQAQIIQNLETSDLVLCDMSSLNPNVFFELGIRTALNRPVCMLRDNVTPTVPFDNSMINYHTYLSDLTPWTLDAQVQRLNEHIRNSVERSKGQNGLWRYFGLTTIATPPAEETSVDAKVDRLTLQVEALNRRLEDSVPRTARRSENRVTNEDAFVNEVFGLARNLGHPIARAHSSSGRVELFFADAVPEEFRSALMDRAVHHGIRLSITEG